MCGCTYLLCYEDCYLCTVPYVLIPRNTLAYAVYTPPPHPPVPCVFVLHELSVYSNISCAFIHPLSPCLAHCLPSTPPGFLFSCFHLPPPHLASHRPLRPTHIASCTHVTLMNETCILASILCLSIKGTRIRHDTKDCTP